MPFPFLPIVRRLKTSMNAASLGSGEVLVRHALTPLDRFTVNVKMASKVPQVSQISHAKVKQHKVIARDKCLYKRATQGA